MGVEQEVAAVICPRHKIAHDRRLDGYCWRCHTDCAQVAATLEIPLTVGGITIADHADLDCTLLVDDCLQLQGVATRGAFWGTGQPAEAYIDSTTDGDNATSIWSEATAWLEANRRDVEDEVHRHYGIRPSHFTDRVRPIMGVGRGL